MIIYVLLPGLSLRSNPGLKLANAYGVTIERTRAALQIEQTRAELQNFKLRHHSFFQRAVRKDDER